MTEQERIVGKSSKSSLTIIFVTVFIDLLGFGIVLPLLPLYGKHFGADGRTLGLLMASFSAMQFLFAPVWGRVSDRVGRRPILILGLAGSTFFYALFGVATALGQGNTLLGLDTLSWLFVARIGAGIAGATIPTAQAYIADTTGTAERGKGMALIGAAFGIGFTFGPLLGAAFVPAEGNDPLLHGLSFFTASADGAPSAAPGYVASVLSGMALLSAIFFLPESLSPGAKAREHHWFDTASLRKAVSQPVLRMILLTMCVTTFAFAQFESTLALVTQGLDMGPRKNFYVFAYVGFILTLSQGVIVRRLLPRLGEFRMSVIGAGLMTVGLLMIGVAQQQDSTDLLYAFLPISVIGFSALTPSLQSMLSLRTSASDQGGVLGLGQSVAAFSRILGPYVGIVLFDEFGPTIPYWEAGGLMAISMLFVLTLRSPPPVADGSTMPSTDG